MDRIRKKPFFITLFDGIIIAGVLICIGALAFFIYSDTGGPLRVHIRTAGENLYFDLNEEREVTVRGPVGETVIAIHDKQVEVLSSDCPAKTCVNSGAINKENGWIACLPNQVMIRIEGTNDAAYDAESY